jgi:hypothetical protein
MDVCWRQHLGCVPVLCFDGIKLLYAFALIFKQRAVNQHYVSRVLLKRFRLPEHPLQCYNIATRRWRAKSVDKACAESGYNQLITTDGIDNTFEEEFSKVESRVPKAFRFLERSADRGSTELPAREFTDLCQYCVFLTLSSIAAKACAVVNFVYQLNLEIEIGQRHLLRELKIPESIIAEWKPAVLSGSRVIIEADNALQLIYRHQFRRRFGDECALYRYTKWVICKSPMDLPIADIGLVPLSLLEPKASRYILPLGPRLVLQGIFFHDVSRNSPNQKLKTLELTQDEAQECIDIICAAAVTEVFCQQKIENIADSFPRAKAAGVEFLQIANPQEVTDAGMKPTANQLHFRLVSMSDFVAFVHSFVKPRRSENAAP